MLYAAAFLAGIVAGGVFIFVAHSRILGAIGDAQSKLLAQVDIAKGELKQELRALSGKI